MTDDIFYENDDLFDTGGASSLATITESLPRVVTRGSTIVIEGIPQFKRQPTIPCPRCHQDLWRGKATLVFKHAAVEHREQPVEAWTCQCGEFYVPGDIAREAFVRAMTSYEAVPTSPAIIVYEQWRLAGETVSTKRAERLFKDGLAAVIHALEFKIETPSNRESAETLCDEVGRVAVYLARELTGMGREPLIWRVCERLLRFFAIRLEFSRESVGGLWKELKPDQVSHKGVSAWLAEHSEDLLESSPTEPIRNPRPPHR